MGEIAGVVKELFDQRPVEAKLLADLLDRLLGRGGPGKISRRIAGQCTRQEEGDDHDADQARDRKHQPLADQGEHGRLPRAWCRFFGDFGWGVFGPSKARHLPWSAARERYAPPLPATSST